MLQFETKSTSAVSALAFSPDGMRLLVGHAKGPVQEWDAFGSLIFENEVHFGTDCCSLAWAPSGTLWVYSFNNYYIVVEAGRAFLGSRVNQLETQFTSLQFLNEDILLVGQAGPTASPAGAFNIHHFNPVNDQNSPAPVYETSGVREVAGHRETRQAAWITGHSRLKLWKVDRPDVREIPLKKTANRVTLSPDGSIVAVAVEWGVQTFSTDKRFPLQDFKGHKGKLTSLAFSPDGRRIVTGSWDETVREWDVTTGKEVRSMQWKIGKISALSYAPDGTRIAAGSTSGKVITWDVD
jgi:WD40 repeat protein